MTEGTSQGLFIVVAIVIFGLFVSLSYNLFGKTLQPQMVSLFENGIDSASESLVNGFTDERFFVFNKEKGKVEAYIDFDSKDSLDLPVHLRIPPTINGIKVTTIGGKAFTRKGLKTVTIPNTVVRIEDGANPVGPEHWGAFSSNNIKEVIVPDSVTYFGYSAFLDNDLNTIKLSKNVYTTGDTSLANNNFKEFKIPEHFTEIGAYTFYNNPLEEIIIPNKVNTIGTYAFRGTKLKELTIPNSVTKIGDYIIESSTDIHTVTLPLRFKPLIESNKKILALNVSTKEQPKNIQYTDSEGNLYID